MKHEQQVMYINQTLQQMREFLYDSVDAFYQMKRLALGNGTVELCNQLYGGMQVYRGIKELANAVGKVPHTEWSGNLEYPLEASFEFCGVRFYQLREAGTD